MEIVWHGVFENLFSQFQQSWQHNWNLMPLGDVQVNNFQIFRDSAKVRFLCQVSYVHTALVYNLVMCMIADLRL